MNVDEESFGANRLASLKTSLVEGLHWANEGTTAEGGPGIPGAVVGVPIGGGILTTFYPAAANGLAVDATTLYWTDGYRVLRKR